MLLSQVHASAPTEGETKSPTITTGSADASASSPAVTILKDVFKLPDHIPQDMLSEAVKICQESKEKNIGMRPEAIARRCVLYCVCECL